MHYVLLRANSRRSKAPSTTVVKGGCTATATQCAATKNLIVRITLQLRLRSWPSFTAFVNRALGWFYKRRKMQSQRSAQRPNIVLCALRFRCACGGGPHLRRLQNHPQAAKYRQIISLRPYSSTEKVWGVRAMNVVRALPIPLPPKFTDLKI